MEYNYALPGTICICDTTMDENILLLSMDTYFLRIIAKLTTEDASLPFRKGILRYIWIYITQA